MNVFNLVKTLRQQGAQLSLDREKIKLLASEGQISQDQMVELKNHRDEVIDYLRQEQALNNQQSGDTTLTPSDFPLANVSVDQLVQWEKSYEIEDIYPATAMQSGMIFHSLKAMDSATYTNQLWLTLSGDINIEVLQQAWQGLAQQQPILRTAFVGFDHKIQQLISKNVNIPWQLIDHSQLSQDEHRQQFELFLENDRIEPFNFAAPPLFRINVFTLADGRSRLVWTYHHVLVDGWCSDLVLQGVMANYAQLLASKPVHKGGINGYKQYITWLCEQNKDLDKLSWQHQLAPLQSVSSMADLNEELTTDNEQHYVELSEQDTAQLAQWARDHNLTLNTLVMGAWAYITHIHSDSSIICFGATVSGRPAQLKGVEKIIGLFINSIPVVTTLDPQQDVISWLTTLQQVLASNNEISYLPLADIQQLSDIDGALFESLVVFENYLQQEQPQGEQPVSDIGHFNQTSLPLTLVVSPAQRMGLQLGYQRHLFSAYKISQLMSHLTMVLQALTTVTPQTVLGALPNMTEQELVWLNKVTKSTQIYTNSDLCLHQLFEEKAQANPDKVALVFEQQQLTYHQLNMKANVLAGIMLSEGVRQRDLVGISLERSTELVVAILAILKCGAAYVSIDPAYPKVRRDYVIDDSKLTVVITGTELAVGFNDTVVTTISMVTLDLDNAELAERFVVDSPIVSERDLAYVIYTSGSTGQPKGVMVEHRNVMGLLNTTDSYFDFNVDDVWTLFHSSAFDFSVWEMWGAFSHGAKLVIVSKAVAQDAARFYQLLETQGVTVLNQTPSAFYVLAYEAVRLPKLSSLRYVIFGGEALDVKQLQDWINRFDDLALNFINMFGITETTVHVTFEKITQSHIEQGLNSIGKALSHLKICLMGESGKPVPPGVTGELYVGGSGVARGYLNNSTFSAERFVENVPGQAGRFYRTGDLARLLPDGRLQYKGRKDHQVKIRGHRIELGEIEAALSQLGDVKANLVIAHKLHDNHQQLLAYVIPRQAEHLTDPSWPDKVKQALAARLPEYMMPAQFVVLESFPQTVNNKIDIKALPQVVQTDLDSAIFEAPAGDVERRLAQIWQQVLGHIEIDVNTNFFTLGGDSILSIQLSSKAKQAGLNLSVLQVFDHPTIRAMAACLDELQEEQQFQKASGSYRVLPIQERFLTNNVDTLNHFNHALLLKLPANIGLTLLEQLTDQLWVKHDSLRLRFYQEGKQWFGQYQDQVIAERLKTIDLSSLNGAEQTQRMSEFCDQAQRSLNIASGELFKLVWFNLGNADENRLLIVAHHLIIDGISWRVLLSDMEQIAQKLIIDQPLLEPSAEPSMAQWSGYLQAQVEQGRFDKSLAYWQKMSTAKTEPIFQDFGIQNEATLATQQKLTFSLESDITNALLGPANEAYFTRVNELLLAGVFFALKGWTQESSFKLLMEGHGRESLSGAPDIGQTLGWFTSLYPWILGSDAAADDTVIKQIKESYRQIPDNGLSFGLLKHYVPELAKFNENNENAIVFNYLGQFDQLLNEQSFFTPSAEDIGSLVDLKMRRDHKLGINAMVIDGCLNFNIDYDTQQYKAQTISNFGELLLAGMRRVVDVCNDCRQPEHTVSDFPLAALNEQQLHLLAQNYQIKDIYPATGMQEGLLFQTELDKSAYVTQVLIHFEQHIEGSLFKQAWESVIARHDIFTTSFSRLDDGRLMQVVTEQVNLPWHEETLTENKHEQFIEDYRKADKRNGFDSMVLPLMRIKLWHLVNGKTSILWSHHHSLLDGWSLPLVFNEVVQCYHSIKVGARPALPSVTRYKQYIKWLHERDQVATKAYWQQYLSGFDAINQLPESGYYHDRTGTDVKSVTFTPAQSEQLKTAVCEHQTTLNILVQAAWALLLSRYSGDNTILFGTPVSGRPADINGIDDMVGLFINTIAVRIDIERDKPIGVWLKQLYQSQIEREQHEYYSLGQIQRCAQFAAGESLFDSALVFQNYPVEESLHQKASELGLPVGCIEMFEQSDYGMVATVKMTDILNIKIQYQRDRFSSKHISQLLSHFKHLLLELSNVNVKDRLVKSVHMLDEQQRGLLLNEFNNNCISFDESICLHELIEAQVQRTPNAMAVSDSDFSLTYQELNQQANKLAHYLIEKGVVPEQPVGLYFNRSALSIVGLLGILKAGGAFVSIDMKYPSDRVDIIIEDSAMQVIVTHSSMMSVLPSESLKIVPLDFAHILLANHRDENIEKAQLTLTSDNLAYVLYTSGSTGKPKGVMVEHSNVVNLAFAQQPIYQVGPDSHVLQFFSISFDASVLEWVMALVSGARLVVCDDDLRNSAQGLSQLLIDEKITHAILPPALLAHMDVNLPYVLQMLAVGGEALDSNLRKAWASKFRMINCYGPTEATVWVAAKELEVDGLVTIGTPVANVRLYVTNSIGELLPEGVVGELCIGGKSVARGYINPEAQREGRFVDDPFCDNDSGRLYKTGDLVRLLSNGELEILGRIDEQVKIHGHRIELGEIESYLTALDDIQACVVMIHTREDGHPQLVAYFEPCESLMHDNSQFKDALRSKAVDHFPGYMVPSIFIGMNEFPVTSRGKIDRKALPLPSPVRADDGSYVAPVNEIEQLLCSIWQDVLTIENVGINDNFFALGGDSILAILMVSRSSTHNLQMNINQLFESPTIAQLAVQLEFCENSAEKLGNATGQYKLLPAQQRFFEMPNQARSHFNHSILLNTPADFNGDALETLAGVILDRHDSFRLKFIESSEGWVGQYCPVEADSVANLISVIDLSDVPKALRSDEIKQQCDQLQTSLDITKGVVFKLVWLHFEDATPGRLLLIAHHLIIDGVSWRVLLADLEQAYYQLQVGTDIELAAKTDYMQTWSEFLQEQIDNGEFDEDRRYWKSILKTPTDSLLNALPEGTDNTLKNAVSHNAQLSKELTSKLIGPANLCYSTQINELLLSALYLALKNWTGGNRFRISMEGHGRETFEGGPDLSQTAGWFTSLYPLVLEAESSKVGQIIRQVKENYRRLPRNGLSYGVLRYQSDSELVESVPHQPGNVLFNYLGQFDQVINQESTFTVADEKVENLVDDSMPRGYEVGVNSMVAEGCLTFKIDYNRHQFNENEIRDFAELLNVALTDIVEHCTSLDSVIYTPSDFPMVNVTQNQLDQWQSANEVVDLYPATGMQQGLLFHSSVDDSAYINQVFFTIESSMDIDRMKQAWQQVMARHVIFNTSFVGEETGKMYQLVVKNAEPQWDIHDVSALPVTMQDTQIEEYRLSDKQIAFDMSQAPLMRFCVWKLGNEHYKMMWTHHHSLLDGWSVKIVFNEVLACYHSPHSLPKFVHTYKDYIQWLQYQDVAKAREYWKQQLVDINGLTLLPEAANVEHDLPAKLCQARLNQAQSDAVVTLAKNHNTTVNVVVQAVWSYLLYRYSAQETVIFGTTLSGRPAELPGIARMVGLFINTIPAVVNVPLELSFSDWLEQIHHQVNQRDSFGFLALSDIQRQASALVGNQLFDHLLIFENYPKEDSIVDNAKQSELEITNIKVYEETGYGMVLKAWMQDVLHLDLEYRDGQYEPHLMPQFLNNFTSILNTVCDNPQCLVGDMLEVKSDIKPLVSKPNNGYTHIHQLFEAQVRAVPEAVAVRYLNQSVSYAELEEKSVALARKLVSSGIKVQDRVGICVERNIDMLVGVLAIFKAGGVFVPLDQNYPKNRLEYMVEDSGITTTLCHQSTLEVCESLALNQIIIDDDGKAFVSDCDLPKLNQLNDIAYIVYTSGTTGKPKGVIVEHSAVIAYCNVQQQKYELEPEQDHCLHMASISFDVFTGEWTRALCTGNTLVLCPRDYLLDAEALYSYMVDNTITVAFFVPSVLKNLAVYLEQKNDSLDFLRWCIVGADVWPAADNLRVCRLLKADGFGRGRLINSYGLTEATVDSTYYDATELDVNAKRVPIGMGFDNTQLYVLDKKGRQVPLGVQGELYVGGESLARGYLNKPELTAEKFVELKVNGQLQRLYRSGDLVYQHADGNVDLIGRIDNQVKLRGYRIELGEIEHTLRLHDQVVDSAAAIKVVENKPDCLVGYLVIETDEELSENRAEFVASLKAHLQLHVPSFMVPDVFVFVDKLALSPNGKIDRKALPLPTSEDFLSQSGEGKLPINELEEEIKSLFESVLPVESVSTDDNFFSLGGDSIMSVQLVARGKSRHLGFSVKDVFEAPTIKELALRVKHTELVVHPQEPVEGSFPLLPIHRQFMAEQRKDFNRYNMSMLLKLVSPISRSNLRTICQSLYKRHDVLRVRFDVIGRQTACHQPLTEEMIDNSVVYHDLSDVADQHSELEALCEQLQSSLNIETGPLIKLAYFKMPGNGYRLLMLAHHLIIDGVSWRILLADMKKAMSQISQGQLVELAPKTSSYQVWARFLEEYGQSLRLVAQQDYWQKQLGDYEKAVEGLDDRFAGIKNDGMSRIHFGLDEQYTTALIGAASDAFRTRPNELMLAALFQANRVCYQRHALQIHMEGHGREELNHAIDCSETMGWFTTTFPLVLLADQQSDLDTIIKITKEAVRNVPENGIGFGVLQHYSSDSQLRQLLTEMQDKSLVFNYLGQFDGVFDEQDPDGFVMATENRGRERVEYSPDEKLIINATVVEKKFEASLVVMSKQLSCCGVEEFFSAFEQALMDIIDYCVAFNGSAELKEKYKNLTFRQQEDDSSASIEEIIGIEI